MPSPLDNLVAIGKLKAEPPTRGELDGLLRSGEALTDAANETLSLESRFDLAYNAAHAFSLAALRARGYRSDNRYLATWWSTRAMWISTWRSSRPSSG